MITPSIPPITVSSDDSSVSLTGNPIMKRRLSCPDLNLNTLSNASNGGSNGSSPPSASLPPSPRARQWTEKNSDKNALSTVNLSSQKEGFDQINDEFNKFLQVLREIANISDGDTLSFERSETGTETMNIVKSSQIWDTFSRIIGIQSSETHTDEMCQSLLEILEKGKHTLLRYVNYISVMKGSEQESKIRALRFLATLSEKAGEKLKSWVKNDVHKEQLLRTFDYLKTNNPYHVKKYICFGDDRTFWEWCTSGLFQSEKLEDIDWKINRYQALLKEVQKGIDTILNRCFPDDSNAELLNIKNNFKNDVFEGVFASDLSRIDGESCSQMYLDWLRISYYYFVTNLRSLAENLSVGGETDKPEHVFVMSLCEFFYSNIDLHDSCVSLVKKFDDWGGGITSDFGHFIQKKTENDSLTRFHDAIHDHMYSVPLSAKAPIANQLGNSLRGRFNIGFDPNTQSNFPHKLAELTLQGIGGQSKSVKVLGFGSPTYEGCMEYAQVVPEFQAFLYALRRQNKKHLFVLQQNYIPGWRFLGGDETDRINAIVKLTEELVFRETLYVLVRSKNSNFYHQSKEFESLDNADVFKENVIKESFDVEPAISGNLITKPILESIPKIKIDCESFVNAIHLGLFGGRKTLTKGERQIFNDVFEDVLILYVIANLSVDSLNITCKDGIDRAADTIARLWSHIGLVNDSEKLEEFGNTFFVMLFSRAMMVRKRPPIEERVKRNKQSVEFYEKHKTELKGLHNKIFSSVKIIPEIKINEPNGETD